MSTLRSPRSYFRRTAALVLAVACVQGCSRSEAPAPKPADAAAPAPVPAPDNLAAELVVPHPAELWGSLRALLGQSVGFVPANVELLLAGALDLPAVAASSIVADRPLLGAVLLAKGGEPRAVLAVRITSGAELVARLTSGADAAFKAVPKASGLTLLERKAPKPPALGVLADHLLVGSQAEDLTSAGPWLVRTLANKAPPAEPLLLEIGESALSGTLSSALTQSWQAYQKNLRELDRSQRQAKGRAPDFGDPAVLIAAADQSVRALLDLLSTMHRIRVRLVPAAGSLRVEVELEPAPGRFAEQSIAELPAGSLEPLLALPRETALAVMLRSSAEERAAAAKDAGLGLEQLLGTRLSEQDRRRLREGLAALHEGRGDSTLYGVLTDRTLFAKSEVSDVPKLAQGVRDSVRLLQLPALKAPFAEFFGDFTLQRSERKLGELAAQRYVLRPRKAGAQGLEALFAAHGGQAALVVGAGAAPALGQLLSPPPATLAADQSVAVLAAGLEQEVAFALFADAAGLGFAENEASGAPALLALTRRGRSARLALSSSAAAFSSLVAWLRKGE